MPPSSPKKTSWFSDSDLGEREEVDPGAAIELRDVTLKFLSYHDKQYSLKQAALDLVFRRVAPEVPPEYTALRNVDLRIDAGERVGIVGSNGAGKSSLLRVISRIYPPTSGTVRVRGSVAPLIEMGAGFNVELSGRDNIRLNGAMLGFSRREMDAKAPGIWDFTGLGEFQDLPLKYYSSGMYSRLAFAIATEIEPDILLLDESLNAGDAAFMAKAKARIRGLLDRSNVVVIVSHDMNALRDLCTRGVRLTKGRVTDDGPIDEVIDRYLAETTAVPA
jgi:ABC-type polysaccharide/polyol phosphate transport system ATPase subunit